jgi:hypothetical protein
MVFRAMVNAINENDFDTGLNKNEVLSAIDELAYLLPSVLQTLESSGQFETYLKFNYLLAENKVSLDNICYFLIL